MTRDIDKAISSVRLPVHPSVCLSVRHVPVDIETAIFFTTQ